MHFLQKKLGIFLPGSAYAPYTPCMSMALSTPRPSGLFTHRNDRSVAAPFIRDTGGSLGAR